MNKNLTNEKSITIISSKEQKLLELLHTIEFGRLEWTIFMEDGQPTRIEQKEGTRSIKL